MGNMSCRHTGERGPRSHITYLCTLGSSQQHQSVCYLEDFCLAGVGVCVLLPGLLGVMLVLPLGPDLTGTTLELGSALAALPRHIWTHKITGRRNSNVNFMSLTFDQVTVLLQTKYSVVQYSVVQCSIVQCSAV